jgi:hypothetical protein
VRSPTLNPIVTPMMWMPRTQRCNDPDIVHPRCRERLTRHSRRSPFEDNTCPPISVCRNVVLAIAQVTAVVMFWVMIMIRAGYCQYLARPMEVRVPITYPNAGMNILVQQIRGNIETTEGKEFIERYKHYGFKFINCINSNTYVYL